MKIRTFIPLLLLGLAAACSTDDSKSLRSAGPSPKKHADAVPEEASAPEEQKPAQRLPDDEAHDTQAGGEPVASSPGSGSAAEPIAATPPPAPTESDAPTVGIRNFRQINDTFAALTGVPRTTAAIALAFTDLATQLPDNNDIRTFAGSHQVAISKLAVEYCDAMIENAALSAAAIPGFNFAATPTVAFNAQGKDLVAKALIAKFWGTGLESAPAEGETIAALAALIDDTAAGKANTAQITKNVVKGVCTALLASGQVLFL